MSRLHPHLKKIKVENIMAMWKQGTRMEIEIEGTWCTLHSMRMVRNSANTDWVYGITAGADYQPLVKAVEGYIFNVRVL